MMGGPLLRAQRILSQLRASPALSSRSCAHTTTAVSANCPARVGMKLEDIETPALVVLLDKFEANLESMKKSLGHLNVTRTAPLKFRPHAKTHKSGFVALQQIARGAVGVCVQKTSEAEAMVAAGVKDVLVSNEVVSVPKLRRLATLATTSRISVCCDDISQVKVLAAEAKSAGVVFNVLVEVNIGGNRCGTTPELCVEIAKLINTFPSLRFGGLQAYHGSAQHTRKYEARRKKIMDGAEIVRHTRKLLTAAGVSVPLVTGGGTGSYLFEAESGEWDELQVGSYCFMDVDYARNEGLKGGPQFQDVFQQSLFILTTVISKGPSIQDPKSSSSGIVVDAGLKASSTDSGSPDVYSLNGSRRFSDSENSEPCQYAFAGDEHGIVFGIPVEERSLGMKLMLAPGHIDPTVNMHDWGIGVRNGVVETIWPIARSPGQ